MKGVAMTKQEQIEKNPSVAGHPDYYVHFGIGVTIDYSARPTEG